MKRMVNSELINSLGNDIKFDEMGNVTVGRNLEVDGNIFTLNGKQWGIMPVCTDIDNVITNKGYIIYSKKPRIFSPATNITVFQCRGIYLNETGNVYIFSYSPSADNISIENDILYIKSNEAYTSFFNSAFNMELAENEVSQIKNKQNKLYRHVINVGGGTMPDSYFGYIVYISTSNLEANSLQDLKTLTKATAGFRYPLSGLCIQGGVAGRPTATNYNVLGYDGSTWHVDSGSTTTDSPTITSASDTVTAL